MITTNAGNAQNLRVLRVSDKNPIPENWVEFVPEDAESKLEDLDVVQVKKQKNIFYYIIKLFIFRTT